MVWAHYVSVPLRGTEWVLFAFLPQTALALLA